MAYDCGVFELAEVDEAGDVFGEVWVVVDWVVGTIAVVAEILASLC